MHFSLFSLEWLRFRFLAIFTHFQPLYELGQVTGRPLGAIFGYLPLLLPLPRPETFGKLDPNFGAIFGTGQWKGDANDGQKERW